MSHRMARLVLPMLVALAAVAQNGVAQSGGTPVQPAGHRAAPAVDHEADAQAIRGLSQRWLAALQKKDVDGVMAHFATDAAAVYGGKLLTGAAAIRRNYESDLASFATERPGFAPSWRTTAVEVAEAGDMAFESGTYDDSWNGGKDHERGNYLTVWRKVGSEWKVARDIGSPEAASAATKRAP
jgi:ketosteroid isomerase-like protein